MPIVPGLAAAGVVRWGDQLDLRPIDQDPTGEWSAGRLAGYVAKYVTNSAESIAGPGLGRP